ncbi:MAG: hypothetical protein HYX52_03470 [Chloroflexi bacterium]|nr:hypothetical protein [Chloroflexota bacterium]
MAARGAERSAPETIAGVTITHPDKLLWARDGIAKRDLAAYQAWIAPVMLRYAAGRPLTLRPFPRGLDQPGFYLKDKPKGAPPWLQTYTETAESTGEPIDFIVAADARTLVWLAQFNAPEVHTWLSTVDRPDLPDWAVMDLDPGDDTPWDWVARSALAVRETLAAEGLESFAKLSGSSGVHVMVPLEPIHPYDSVRRFMERVAERLEAWHGDVVTTQYHTRERGRRVLFDYAQNAHGKNTVCAYSVRASPGAPVSAPIGWEELHDPLMRSTRFTLGTMRERLEAVGDLLEPALKLRQRLPER